MYASPAGRVVSCKKGGSSSSSNRSTSWYYVNKKFMSRKHHGCLYIQRVRGEGAVSECTRKHKFSSRAWYVRKADDGCIPPSTKQHVVFTALMPLNQ